MKPAAVHRDKVVEKIGKDEAAEIIANERPNDMPPPDEVGPQVINARLVIYSPVLDDHAKTWKFIYGDRHITVDISESGIAEDVLRRGMVRVGDAYLVSLEITERKTAGGKFTLHHKALRYSQFLPAPHGAQMPLSIPIQKDSSDDND